MMRVFLIAGVAALLAGPALAGTAYFCKVNQNTSASGHDLAVGIFIEDSGQIFAMDAWSHDEKSRPDPIPATVKSNAGQDMTVTWQAPGIRYGVGHVTDASYRMVLNKADKSFDLTISLSGETIQQHHVGRCRTEAFKG